jgi:hypothetical protein
MLAHLEVKAVAANHTSTCFLPSSSVFDMEAEDRAISEGKREEGGEGQAV